MPPLAPGAARNAVLNRFDWPRLHSEWPGCVSVYSWAVDSGPVLGGVLLTSRLNALAVYALALAIAWLPGHTCVGSDWLVAYAHSSPSRFTTAPHILVPWKSPPASPVRFGEPPGA